MTWACATGHPSLQARPQTAGPDRGEDQGDEAAGQRSDTFTAGKPHQVQLTSPSSGQKAFFSHALQKQCLGFRRSWSSSGGTTLEDKMSAVALAEQLPRPLPAYDALPQASERTVRGLLLITGPWTPRLRSSKQWQI